MTFGTLSAHRAARHSIVQPTGKLILGMLLSSVATVAIAQPASGDQTAPPAGTNTPSTERATQANPGPAAPAPQAAQDTGSGLGAIIVTATKRETNLQRTPIAINVANTQALTDRHANSLLDLGDGAIPSLRVATFEARQSALVIGIRGITPFDANQTARDQGVGTYIDGVYQGRQQGLNTSLLDIDRVEVLKGPQGTLFGRNTEGGAVSIITKAPTGVFGMRGNIGVGNYGQKEGEIHIDLPAVANFAVKIDGVYQHQNATVKNPLSGQTGWNYRNVVGGRIQGRWTPVEGLTVDLSYDHTKDENTPNYSQLITYNPNGFPVGVYGGATGNTLVFAPGSPNAGQPCSATVPGTGGPGQPAAVTYVTCVRPLSPLVVVSGGTRQRVAEIGVPQQPSEDITHGFTGTIKYKVSPDLELRSITAFRGLEEHQWDNSGGPHRVVYAPNGLFSRYSLSEMFQHQFSQEFQAVGNIAHQLDYVLGAYYFREKATETAATPNTNFWMPGGNSYIILSENGNGVPQPPFVCGNSSGANIIQITTANPAGGGSTTTTLPAQGWNRAEWCPQRDSHTVTKSYAVFGQVTWTPAGFDIFHLTAGARYTKDKRNGTLDIVNGRVTNFPFVYDKSRVDPLVVAAIDATQNIHLYAKYSTGFRAGGANDRSKTFTAFGPESVQAYEIGSKMDLFDHLARLNLAAYYMRRKGTQTDFDSVDTDPSSPTFNAHTEETRNAPGVSKIKGFEADLTVRPIRELTLGASYAYTDVKNPLTPNPFLNNAPFQVFSVFTPKHAAAGYADFEVPSGLETGKIRLHIDANYSGRSHSFQAENVLTDKSFVVNGRVALADVEVNHGSTLLTFSLWARNLFNTTYIYRRSAANSVPTQVAVAGVLQPGIFTYAGVLGDYGNFNPPRTWGAELAFKIGAPRIAPPPYVPPPPPPPPPATVTCESGTVITAPGVCPPPPPLPPPPPPPEPTPERGS